MAALLSGDSSIEVWRGIQVEALNEGLIVLSLLVMFFCSRHQGALTRMNRSYSVGDTNDSRVCLGNQRCFLVEMWPLP